MVKTQDSATIKRTLYFFWQIIVNIGMVVGLMPVVGMPLPFISYGGTALAVQLAEVGIVLSVSRQMR